MNELIASLKATLGDCKRLQTSTCLLKTSYEIITNRIFYILDDRETQLPVRIARKMENHQLTINNKNKYENEICLVKTDKCLFTDAHQKCDCMLFNRFKFFFVEISEAKNRGTKRKQAVVQLGTTIGILRDNKIDLSAYETKAIICFKNGETRPTRASFSTQREVFRAQYKISLEEGNEISF